MKTASLRRPNIIITAPVAFAASLGPQLFAPTSLSVPAAIKLVTPFLLSAFICQQAYSQNTAAKDLDKEKGQPAVVKSLDGLSGWVTLSAGANITITRHDNDLRISAIEQASQGGPDTNAWHRGGDIAGPGDSLGTLNNVALEIKAGGARALRLEPAINGPNLIGGSDANFVMPETYGATISGGTGNSIGAANNGAVIGGGSANTCQGAFSTISGGTGNLCGRDGGGGSVIGGGAGNVCKGPYATIGGGAENFTEADALYAGIGGGIFNTNTGYASVIAGGSDNAATGIANYASIGGGYRNTVTNSAFAVVPGGSENVAAATWAFAAGHRAISLHQGAFVWADSTDADIASTDANQFTVRAAGGVRMFTDSGATNGAALAPGSGSWSSLSDHNAKRGVEHLDPREVLKRLVQMPVSKWSYSSQNPSIRHIGPMAQDFYSAFQVGEDDRHISTVDADGVALAAIQGLNAALEEKDARIRALEQDLTELKAFVNQLASKPRAQ